jgi:hypothetical protein
MAVNIPIISEFDSKGIKTAINEFKSLEGAGAKTSFAIKKAAVPAGLAIAGLTAFLTKAAKGAEEARQANQRLDQVLTSMGFGETTKRVSEYAEQLERTIAVDADVIKATQTKLATFSELTKTVDQAGGAFDRATLAALDMAAAGFGTAESNAIQLGKALQDPIKGITALAKSGVTFTEQEKDKIETLVKSNQLLAAQDIVLQAIEKQVGGTAEASASSFAKIQFAFAGIADTFGELALPAIDKFAEVMQKVAVFVQNNQKLVGFLTIAVGSFAAGILVLNTILKIATTLQLAFNLAMAMSPIGLVVTAVALLVAGFGLLVAKTGSVKNAFATMGNFIIGIFERIANTYVSMLNLIIRGLNLLPGVSIDPLGSIELGRFSISKSGGGTTDAGPDFLERKFATPAMPSIDPLTLPAPAGGGGGGGGGSTRAGGGGGGGNEMTIMPDYTGFIRSDDPRLADYTPGELARMGNAPIINVTVNAAIAEASLGQTIVDALTDYSRSSGPLELQIAV